MIVKPLKFKKEQSSQKMHLQTDKIGWIHSQADKKGAKFDLTIKDSVGRVLMEKKNCGNETEKYGEFLGLEHRMGEEVEVLVENIKNADNVDIIIN